MDAFKGLVEWMLMAISTGHCICNANKLLHSSLLCNLKHHFHFLKSKNYNTDNRL